MAFLSTVLARWRARRRQRSRAGVVQLQDRIGAPDRIDDALFEGPVEPMSGRSGADRLRGPGALVVAAGCAALVVAVFRGGAGATAPEPRPAPAVVHTRLPAAIGCGRACDPAVVRSAIQQPLRLSRLGASSRCPVSEVRRFPPGAGFNRSFIAAVSGTLRLALVTRSDGTVSLAGSSRIGAWYVRRIVWVFDPAYGGPVLLRGDRVDGPGDLAFGNYLDAAGYDAPPGSSWPHGALLYIRGGLGAPAATGVTSYPSSIAVDGPGCFAIQVDGERVSDVLVFRVTWR